MLKILVDAHYFDEPYFSGVHSYLMNLYNNISISDVEIYIACRDIDNASKHFHGSYFRFIKTHSRSRFKRFFKEFPAITKEHKIDYVHFQYVCPPSFFYKTILTLHDVLFEDYPQYFPIKYRVIRHFLFKYSAKLATRLYTVSDYSRQRIHEKYGIALNNIHITYNTVNPIFFIKGAPNIVKRDNIGQYILYISRFEPRKNQKNALDAFFKGGFDNHYSFVFIGKRDLEVKEFDSYYLNLTPIQQSKVYFYDNIPIDELVLWVQGASAFVFTSLAEGFGIPPLEAAAAKVPVVCSNRTAMSDFLFFKDNLVNPDDQQAIINAINKCLKETEEKELRDIQRKIYDKYNALNISNSFITFLRENK